MRCRVCDAELPATAEWCSQCLTPIEPPQPDDGGDGLEPAPSVGPPPEYSALRKGPYSFGVVGKVVITLIIVALGVGLYFVASWLAGNLGTPALGLVLLFLTPYSILAVIFLWGTWRPTRVK